MSDLDYDPYRLQRAEERKRAKQARFDASVTDVMARLRKKAGKGPSRAKAQHEPHTSIAKVESDRSRKNSRVKGNRGELDVAKAFSKWCGEHVRRTPGSGGWAGSQDFGTTADLVCTKKAFPFHVEVKHREGWVLDDLLTGDRKDHDKSIVQWWNQCVESCPLNHKGWEKKTPLLVFRRNRQPWFVMMRGRVFDDADPRLDLTWSVATIDTVIDTSRGRTLLTVMRLDDFLELEPVPEGLKNHWPFKRRRK